MSSQVPLCSLLRLSQNFSAVRTAYADKLKKLREASRSGTTQSAATPGECAYAFSSPDI
jgi:hypothetical protein